MRRSVLPRLAVALAFAVQAALVALLFAVYGYGRHLADGRPDVAFANAERVRDLQRVLRLPDEAALQEAALRWDGWARIANEYYVRVHFPATFLFLGWIWFWRRAAWPRLLAVVALSLAVALAIHTLYPLAPPRLLPGGDFVDLMNVYGPSSYATEPGEGMANQFAAMPSLHVGWAVLVAWGVIRYGRGRWRWLAVAHPVVTLLVVVLTANHYWLDGIVGSVIVATALAVTVRLERRRGPARAGLSVRRDSVGA
ncbi:inositol phosphorylceramide synthase [Actinomadura rudentiformis]|uniref:Inositol phosphorylceramide synthase n=1 Tax=Actinomadura rudentiformis TaxID=359158 RepID=A0A6H9YIW2_9ACTN|nr:inositol phosphorylceramide synthase [Actinomadura rudentiformis]